MTEGAMVVVQVKDVIDAALTGRDGCAYLSPPQPREQALTLVRVLLGYTSQELNGAERWTCPIAGGRRTVTLNPARSDQEEDYHHGHGDRSQEAGCEDRRSRRDRRPEI